MDIAVQQAMPARSQQAAPFGASAPVPNSVPSTPTVADPRWHRILARDRTADGRFWYSVRTTGVYCRPSCPSRAARPENVAIHLSLTEARRTGCRPCRRCRPDEAAAPDAASSTTPDAVIRACRLIEESETPPPLGALAAAAGLSPAHFHRLFRSHTGLTPHAFAAAHRAARLRDALHAGEAVTPALFAAGFNSTGRFYAQADSALGMTPTRFRGGGEGEVIRFALGQCALGAILVAQGGRGLCAILLGDDPEALLRDLERRFPRTHLLGGEPGFEALVAQVVGFVEQPRIGLALPLDLRGTAFQVRVWQALQDIPPGTTLSYAQLAARLGLPRATRAVAGACAGNALAVAIPCHRVVRTGGAISGYRWGVERKRELLRREAATAAPRDSIPEDHPDTTGTSLHEAAP